MERANERTSDIEARKGSYARDTILATRAKKPSESPLRALILGLHESDESFRDMISRW